MAVAALGVAGHATLIEPNRVTVSSVEIPAGPLAGALGGGRVVHLSDLHFRGEGLRERRLLAAIREAAPDLVLMTGDYADTPEGIRSLGTFFAGLHPPLGVIAVPGNNDYYRGRQAEIFQALAGAGVRILRNDAVILQGRGGAFAVAGVDDPFFGRDDVEETLGAIPHGMPAILLAHSPAVLLSRSRAMLFNAGDSLGPWGEGSFWTDGSHFREPESNLRFEGAGERIMRVQRREDGAGIASLRLVPVSDLFNPEPVPRGLQGHGLSEPQAGDGSLDLDLCSADTGAGGSWSVEPAGEGGCLLRDGPDRGRMASFAAADPDDYVEIRFEAPAGRAYRLWAKIQSPTGSGLSDSFFVQFDGAVDESGDPLYRIGQVESRAAGERVDLILAGHTHGGQVRLPWIGALEERIQLGPYVMGRYEVDGSMVYVSRGVGTSYLPVRFGCPPEVVVLGAGGGGVRG